MIPRGSSLWRIYSICVCAPVAPVKRPEAKMLGCELGREKASLVCSAECESEDRLSRRLRRHANAITTNTAAMPTVASSGRFEGAIGFRLYTSGSLSY